ncbi:MAG: hypothetical protein LC679_07510 [Intrasporangiaceae bacterium]|nr:hypothetical protein [Intrasporangiaceae bacterium]
MTAARFAHLTDAELRQARTDYIEVGDGTQWEAERIAELETELAERASRG